MNDTLPTCLLKYKTKKYYTDLYNTHIAKDSNASLTSPSKSARPLRSTRTPKKSSDSSAQTANFSSPQSRKVLRSRATLKRKTSDRETDNIDKPSKKVKEAGPSEVESTNPIHESTDTSKRESAIKFLKGSNNINQLRAPEDATPIPTRSKPFSSTTHSTRSARTRPKNHSTAVSAPSNSASVSESLVPSSYVDSSLLQGASNNVSSTIHPTHHDSTSQDRSDEVWKYLVQDSDDLIRMVEDDNNSEESIERENEEFKSEKSLKNQIEEAESSMGNNSRFGFFSNLLRFLICAFISTACVLGYYSLLQKSSGPEDITHCPNHAICEDGIVKSCLSSYTLVDNMCVFSDSSIQNMAYDLQKCLEMRSLDSKEPKFQFEEYKEIFPSEDESKITVLQQALRDGEFPSLSLDSDNAISLQKDGNFLQQMRNLYSHVRNSWKEILFGIFIFFIFISFIKYDSSTEAVDVLRTQIWKKVQDRDEPSSISELRDELKESHCKFYTSQYFSKALNQLSNELNIDYENDTVTQVN